MITVNLIGHENYYGLGDILRLFFGNVREDRDGHKVTSGSDLDISIISRAEKDGAVTFVEGEEDYWNKKIPDRFKDRVDIKREVKRQLYLILSEKTGRNYPWGSLTGIRPTVVASEEKSAEDLTLKYMVRPDKADLCMETSRNEADVLGRTDKDKLNVYIGVPFCPSRCAYCSFVSEDISHHMGRLKDYSEALCDEISWIGRKLDPVTSVYMGGGTPTVFSDEDFARVIETIMTSIPTGPDTEITIEAGRADTVTESKLKVMREYGMKRICINPQTLSDETLRKYNRKHTVKDFLDVFEKAKELGFEVINCDLIAGLNMEEPKELLESLSTLIGKGPENITIHTLYKKRRASLEREKVMGDDGDHRLDSVLSEAYKVLSGNGYIPYYMYRQKDTSHGLENVGFSLPGKECIYNVAMMSDRRSVIALGAGAMSKRMFGDSRLERFPTPKDVLIYIRDHEEIMRRKADFFGL